MTALPNGYRLRPVTLDDLDSVVDLMNRASIADIGTGGVTASRLRTFWLGPDRNLATDNWIVEDAGGEAVAYMDFNEYAPYDLSEFYDVIDPEHRGRGIEEALIAVASERASTSIAKASPEATVRLETDAWASDPVDVERHLSLGFSLTRVWNRMQIEMTDFPPAPAWPKGISVRTFQPDEVLDVHQAWEDAQRDEWGFSSLTPDEFRYYFVENEENFDPTLWFLAIDDTTGTIAGYALCRWERPGVPECGHIRYVAVRRQYRRRGIAQALLLHTFREFYARGKRQVGLAVDSTSLTGADRLYERVGMRPIQQSVVFSTVLREGAGETN
ncbi:MAG TPA: GNAT family N-acetyltransferase [Thermomicrobiales bacterium]|nr:GNAT family N-acetyltransferase [Thermomicrobiales bacterium]